MTKWIKRKKTKVVKVGDVAVGGDNPISIQSMTNTDTCDVVSTVKQINDLEFAGADIVRVSVPGFEEAKAFKEIKSAVNIPLVADIHFDYKIALEVADSADCLRINPGNIGKEDRIKEVINAAKDNNVPFYVALPSSTIDWNIKDYKDIPIEERNSEELTHVEGLDKEKKLQKILIYPQKSKAMNLAFDVTPAKYVSGLITEKGVCEASEKGLKGLFK